MAAVQNQIQDSNEDPVEVDCTRRTGNKLPTLKSTAEEPVKIPSQYQITERVGHGGMGVIYRAKHRYTGGQVAVKLLHTELTHDPEALKRFAFEARAAASLEHPNIIKIHDFGLNEDQVPYIIMDWIDGIGLSKKIRRDGPMNVGETISVILQVANALAHAHDHKVIHRDLKPENLMLTRDHEGKTSVRVVDFGIAKALAGGDSLSEEHAEQNITVQNLTQTGAIIGSPFYMSPEQGLGSPTDARSDIYSLGCVMYFALLAHAPFEGKNFVETIFRHVNDPVPPLQDEYHVFPKELQAIVMKSLAKDPGERYQTMKEFADDLHRFSAGLTVSARYPAAVLSDTGKRRRSTRGMVASFAGAFILFYLIITVLQKALGQ